jgi:hypothetical protein
MAGKIRFRRVDPGRRYEFDSQDVDRERADRLERLGAVEPNAAGIPSSVLAAALDERDRARADAERFRAALSAQLVADQAHLEALRQFVVPSTAND